MLFQLLVGNGNKRRQSRCLRRSIVARRQTLHQPSSATFARGHRCFSYRTLPSRSAVVSIARLAPAHSAISSGVRTITSLSTPRRRSDKALLIGTDRCDRGSAGFFLIKSKTLSLSRGCVCRARLPKRTLFFGSTALTIRPTIF